MPAAPQRVTDDGLSGRGEGRIVPMPARTRLTAEEVAALVDAVTDPLELRRQQVVLASAHPDLAVPEPRELVDDVREAVRLARAGVEQLSPTAARRYRIVELLLQAASIKAITAAEHVSPRTVYRARLDALAELAPLLDDLWRHRTGRVTTVAAPTESVGESETVPMPRVFVGRAQELARATALLAEQRMLVIGGPAGMGKTSFAAVVAHHEGLLRPVMWHHIRRGLTDSPGGVLFAISRRLSELESDALATFLRQTVSSSPWQAVAQALAVRGIDDNGLTMVFDGAEAVAGNDEVCGLLSSILADARSSRIILVSKERLPLLQEAARLELGGLDAETIEAYLAAHGVTALPAGVVEVLAQHTGGSPQLIHLAAGALLHGELDAQELGDRLLDVGDVQAYFFDHIHGQLAEGAQLVLGAIALVRVPEASSFLAGALDGITPSVPATLAELGRRYLLTYSTQGLRLHASVRELARTSLPVGERRRLHRRLALAYQRSGRFDEACFQWIEGEELMEARNALLANSVTAPPHVRARLEPLARRLIEAGLMDDPELLHFAAALAASSERGARSRRRVP